MQRPVGRPNWKPGGWRAYLAQNESQGRQGWYNVYQLRLEAATRRRTALEARLSETLLRMNASVPGLEAREAFEAKLRQIGDAINKARVEKRARICGRLFLQAR
jgi:hypothetical protein